MKVTPLDVRKQEFKKQMRGYDPVEVDTFLEMVAVEMEDLLRQQKESRDRVVELETQLKDYKQIEKTLQQTLLQRRALDDDEWPAAAREPRARSDDACSLRRASRRNRPARLQRTRARHLWRQDRDQVLGRPTPAGGGTCRRRR